MAQNIPSDKILTAEELPSYLTDSVKKALSEKGEISEAVLAQHFRETFSERYFYNWENNETRIEDYIKIYPELETNHISRAQDHLDKYPSQPKWKLPFNYKNGDPVNAYALRHLARQHKMIDIGYYYFYSNKDEQYLDYFTEQLASLNNALANNQYEIIEDGNGVYEAFRSGYRVLNWLQLHNLFLGQPGYSDAEQLETIATLLQHAQHLYETNKEFHSGNHQTRGLSALAMVAILFPDFKDANQWYKHAMKLLEEHISKEINDDNFQFERTVHYHMSDIGNYFYVYQLMKKSHLTASPFWEEKLEAMFTTLIKVAYPNKSAPVLSDDTDEPWAEYNDISGALTLGYVLFDDPEMGFFANQEVDAKMYWFLSDSQLKMLNNITSKKPEYKSLYFPTTGYYIMRDGWNKNDKMMVISAGLDPLKPDHQHGDMLGVQAMANGKVVLPNYQVRYYLDDLELFKNSMTKNVALVDSELQGKQYTSNKGGSGFGKFKNLPQPTVLGFDTNEELDVFIGSHDGFENIGVTYSRQVIYVKPYFWIVKDNFKSDNNHTYKQVWQGHYTSENGPDLLRASFDDGSGLDILQLQDIDSVKTEGTRGKQWSIISKGNQKNHQFITILFPFETFDARIDEDLEKRDLKGWKLNNSKWVSNNPDSVSLTKEETSIFFNVKELKFDDTKIEFEEVVDVLVKENNKEFELQLLSKKEGEAVITRKGVQQTVNCKLNNN